MYIDNHCHLERDNYPDLDLVIKNMDGIMIVSGYNDKSNLEVIELANLYPNVYATIGIHPENICDITDNSFSIITDNINNPKVVGIGEIGLDYYWDGSNKDAQIELFKKQIELAKKYDKPIVVHSRDAIQDTFDILKSSGIKKIYLHCFSGSKEMALEFIKLGSYLGVGGTSTFKNSIRLRSVLTSIPLERILIETDSPYLTPVPFRGQRNEPKNVKYVVEELAKIKNINVDDVLRQTNANSFSLFDLK